MSYIMGFLISAILIAARIISFLIFIRILFSWVGVGPRGFVTSFVYEFTEMIYYPARTLLSNSPFRGTGVMFDFTPILAIFLINAVSSISVNLINDISLYVSFIL